jgi:hypothetical protein
MADALAPLPVDLPHGTARRRDAASWERRCKRLESAARTLLLQAPLSRDQRAALFGTMPADGAGLVCVTDVEHQILRAYRALAGEDRQAFRRILSALSGVDVAQRRKRHTLAARRRQTITRAGATTKGGA